MIDGNFEVFLLFNDIPEENRSGEILKKGNGNERPLDIDFGERGRGGKIGKGQTRQMQEMDIGRYRVLDVG